MPPDLYEWLVIAVFLVACFVIAMLLNRGIR